MKLNKNKIILLAYTSIAIAVLFWSGKSSEKRLYDKYIVRSSGLVFDVLDQETTKNFYQSVLDIPIENSSPKSFKAVLPDGLVIEFKKKSTILPSNLQINSGGMLKLRVKNGFEQLHASLLQKEKQFQSYNGEISKIEESKKGKEFLVIDPSGNKLLFYKRFKFSRKPKYLPK